MPLHLQAGKYQGQQLLGGVRGARPRFPCHTIVKKADASAAGDATADLYRDAGSPDRRTAGPPDRAVQIILAARLPRRLTLAKPFRTARLPA